MYDEQPVSLEYLERSSEELKDRETDSFSSDDQEDQQNLRDFGRDGSSSPRSNNNEELRRQYSVSELVKTLGSRSSTDLPPELDRRVLDFRLAQQKRRAKYGVSKRWGVFGMYAHLSSVRIDLEWAEDAAWRRQHGEPYLSWTDFDDARLKGRNRPWFTYFIIFVCSVMLIVAFGVNDWKVAPLSVNPMIGPSAEALIAVGARDTRLIVEKGQWFRVFTPLVLHAGIIHYIVNSLALWFIGAAVEQSHGIVNTVVLFFVPGVGGNILSAIFLPQYISVGASGGIFGLLGGCVADIALNWNLLFIQTGEESKKEIWRRNFWAVFFLVAEIIVQIILGLVTPFIDNWAHLGGLVYGACCAVSSIEPLAVGFFGVDTSTWDKIKMLVVRFFGLILAMVLIMVSTVWLATSNPGETPCKNCRYISCVPFPFNKEDKWWYCDDCDFVVANLYKPQGADYYERVDLTCPDKTVEMIDVSAEEISDKEDIRRNLPSYCRDFCDDVFG